MKKVFIAIMFMIPLYIFALDIEKSYVRAMDAYKAKDFQTSYDLLSKLYMTKLSDANLNFSLGMSAYETGHYEMALAAFERVKMLEPVNLRNKLEKARTYFMLKMYEDSELAFKEVLANPLIPENVRKNIELYLSKVTQVQQKSFTYLTIAMDMLYDSNINSGPMDASYTLGNTEYATPDKKSDNAYQVSAELVNIYDIGETNSFAIKNRASAYLNYYQQEKEYDTQYFAYMPSLLYKQPSYTAEIVLGTDIVTLGNKNFLQTLSLMPRFEYGHTNTLRSIAYVKYQTKKFQQSELYNLDANHYELSYGLQNILTPHSYIQANLTGITEKKIQGTRVDVDYNEYKLSATYANQFIPAYGGELYAQIRKRKYDDYNTLFGSSRDDTGKSIALSLSAKIVETLHFKFITHYDRVDSNQNVFSYEKYAISAGVVKTF